MSVPPQALAGACEALGVDPLAVLDVTPVSGGCINQGSRLRTAERTAFQKWNPHADHGFFDVEAEGLAALERTGAIRIPSVIARSRTGSVAWLLLEWIEAGRPERDGWVRLGRELAALHGHTEGPEGTVGWHRDNAIGSLPQRNRWMEDWSRFWADLRILPLVRDLSDQGLIDPGQRRTVEAAAEGLGRLLREPADADGPSLLHGDLWSGNVMFDAQGTPVLIDPAVYVGHREVDLAMCELFGGFPRAFHDAYEESWPLQPGAETRRAAYQLYPLLVHALLFGGSYLASALRAASVVAAS